jgi:hypothetical protein
MHTVPGQTAQTRAANQHNYTISSTTDNASPAPTYWELTAAFKLSQNIAWQRLIIETLWNTAFIFLYRDSLAARLYIVSGNWIPTCHQSLHTQRMFIMQRFCFTSRLHFFARIRVEDRLSGLLAELNIYCKQWPIPKNRPVYISFDNHSLHTNKHETKFLAWNETNLNVYYSLSSECIKWMCF